MDTKKKEQAKAIQKPRGTLAEFGGRATLLDLTMKEVISVVRLYGITLLYLPTFEYAELFTRSIGTDSEIVNKELYTFADRKGREFALRPEGTAGVMRIAIENKLIQSNAPSPLKFYYYGPMFRYERPQKQRRREFLQIGVEYIGGKSSFLLLELIQIVHQILEVLNLTKHVDFFINTIGTVAERKKYAANVRDYFKDSLLDLCSDCQLRYQKNIFRIADCKNEAAELIAEMPSLYDSVSDTEKQKLDSLIHDAKFLKINLKYNKKIVRGLDYYDSIVFEVVNKIDKLAIIAGGSYDSLAEKLGSPSPTSASGFAIGLERLALLWWEHNKENKIFVNPDQHQKFFIYTTDSDRLLFTALLGNILRSQGLFVTSSGKKNLNMTKLYDTCKKRGYLAIIYYQNSPEYYGESNILEHVKIFNLQTGEKQIVTVENFSKHIFEITNQHSEW